MPSGSIQMMITNPEAFKAFMDAFNAGKRFYVNFSEVPSVKAKEPIREPCTSQLYCKSRKPWVGNRAATLFCARSLT